MQKLCACSSVGLLLSPLAGKDIKRLKFKTIGKSRTASPWINPFLLSTGQNGIKPQHWSECPGIFLGALKRKVTWKGKLLLTITEGRRKNIFQLLLCPTFLYPFVWAAITDPYAKRWKLFFRSICFLGRLLSLFYWQLWNHHWVCRVVILQMVCMGGLFLRDEISLWTPVWI